MLIVKRQISSWLLPDLMRLFWLDACLTRVSSASRTESVTLYLKRGQRRLTQLYSLVDTATWVKGKDSSKED